jgi:hypothetical protein
MSVTAKRALGAGGAFATGSAGAQAAKAAESAARAIIGFMVFFPFDQPQHSAGKAAGNAIIRRW